MIFASSISSSCSHVRPDAVAADQRAGQVAKRWRKSPAGRRPAVPSNSAIPDPCRQWRNPFQSPTVMSLSLPFSGIHRVGSSLFFFRILLSASAFEAVLGTEYKPITAARPTIGPGVPRRQSPSLRNAAVFFWRVRISGIVYVDGRAAGRATIDVMGLGLRGIRALPRRRIVTLDCDPGQVRDASPCLREAVSRRTRPDAVSSSESAWFTVRNSVLPRTELELCAMRDSRARNGGLVFVVRRGWGGIAGRGLDARRLPFLCFGYTSVDIVLAAFRRGEAARWLA